MSGLKRYYPILWRSKGLFLSGVFFGILYGVSSGLGIPVVIEKVLPLLFESTDSELAKVPDFIKNFSQNQLGGSREKLAMLVCAFIPLIFLIRCISGYLNTYLINKCGFILIEKIRALVFDKLQRLPIAYYHEKKSGDLLSRLTQDAEIIRSSIAQGSNDLIKQPMTLIAALSFLIHSALSKASFPFAVFAALFTMPLLIFPLIKVGKKIGKRARQVQSQMGETSAIITETLQSPLEVRVYQLESRQSNIFSKQLRTALHSMLKVVKYRAMISPAIEFIAASVFASAIWFAAKQGMSLTDFMSVGMALYLAYDPIKKIGVLNSLLKQGAAAASRLDAVLDAEETVSTPPASEIKKSGRATGNITFHNTTFAYHDTAVLCDINLHIRSGEFIALAGPSGSGKTTMVNLLPRLFDPTAGAVLLDGTDLRNWPLTDIRSQIAVVPQMPVLFQDTIIENIRIGNPQATEEQIISAAKKAHAHDFITQLPQGYHTIVGERGSSLSGGQRQRIAIARAFLKNAPILILDEATSALDAESEAAIAETLTELSQGRTTILIAHRFSTIRRASRIIVLEKGKIIADGTYNELQNQPGLFADLLHADSA